MLSQAENGLVLATNPGEANMSVTQPALAVTQGMAATRRTPRLRRGGLQGTDRIWAIAFAVPYAAVFFAFVVYPICYGLWLGGQPALYTQLFEDPRYLTAVVNTLLYVGIGVNVKMVLAFLLSGFFMRKRWWIKALLVVYILPWATPALPAYMSIHWLLNGQWGMLNNILYMLFGFDGPVYLNEHWTGLACNIGAYIWKNMPFWTMILLAGRMAVPQELYEAAAVDGATGFRRFQHVTLPLMGNLYLVCTLLDTIFALGDFNATFFVSGGGPAMSTEVLATLGVRYAFTNALPRLGVAAVMTALPLLVPLVVILMRKLSMKEVQL
jgi:multiple sugar transport system permease protein